MDKTLSKRNLSCKSYYKNAERKGTIKDDLSHLDLRLPKFNLLCSYIYFILWLTIEICKVDAFRDVDINVFPFLRKPDGKIMDPRDYLDFDFLYTPNDTYWKEHNIETHSYNLIKAFDYANYFRTDIWNYSEEEDLKLSSQPIANQKSCGKQLDWILNQLNDTGNILKSGKSGIQLSEYLDSFGRPEPSTTFGNAYWLGSYYVCSQTTLSIPANSSDNVSDQTLKTRYCLGKVRAHSWPKDNYVPPISYKVGLCLPETCDTSSVKLYKDSIEKLMKLNFASFQKDRYYLSDMYCLPDERSPLRQLSVSSYIYISFCLAWICLVIAGTFIYRRQKICAEPFEIEDNKVQLNGNGDNQLIIVTTKTSNNQPGMSMALTKSFSITENFKEFISTPAIPKSKINLNGLDAIKILCTMMIVWGHVIFIYIQHLVVVKQAIIVSTDWFPRLLLSFFNLVDTFFVIAGLLTSYFIFKKFNKKQLSRPQTWILLVVMRLIRLSPVYLIVLWFTKTIVVHLGSGPMWDYGTDELSNRGLCVRDHWWKSILYLGNYDSMQPYCILPSWSIIVDAQYSLLIPPVVWAISRNKRLGYFTLGIGTLVSIIHMTVQLLTQNSVNTNDMAKVRLHVYPLMSRFSAEFYNTMWNRIGPVAIGIMGGHLLFEYETGKLKNWPWWMRGKTFKLVLYLHLSIILLPLVSAYFDRSDSEKKSNEVVFVLCNATIKPIWSIINVILLLRMVTYSTNTSLLSRVINHNIWHNLSKLTYSLYLIHYELILYNHSIYKEGMRQPSWYYFIKEYIYILVCSIMISLVMYIVFEAPIYQLIKILQSPLGASNKKPKEINIDNYCEQHQQQQYKTTLNYR